MAHIRNRAIRPSGQPKVREELPQMTQTKEGAVIWCPFCVPSHPLTPGAPAACGTVLKLTATQTIIPARMARLQQIECLKCHKTGEGDMVPYMSGYIHLTDCAPDTNLLKTPVAYSKLAGLVYHLPLKLRERVCALTNQYPQEVCTLEKGDVIGYYFLKGKRNATRQTAKPAA